MWINFTPSPFLTQMLIEGNCPHHQQAARISFALSLKSATLPGISCLVDSYSGTRVRCPPLQGIYIEPFSTEVRATQGWIPRALITTNSVISALFKKPLQNMPHEGNFLLVLAALVFSFAERSPSDIPIAVLSCWLHSNSGAL